MGFVQQGHGRMRMAAWRIAIGVAGCVPLAWDPGLLRNANTVTASSTAPTTFLCVFCDAGAGRARDPYGPRGVSEALVEDVHVGQVADHPSCGLHHEDWRQQREHEVHNAAT